MALPAPADLPQNLRFVPPSFRSHSRSPSRSPNRKTNFSAHELDPLLGNLSPDSTLKALQTTEAISPSKQEHDTLSKSIKDASSDERALGIRAALAAQKVREWCAELSAWKWADPKEASRGKGFEPPKVHHKSEKYLGSLTVGTVGEYEDRIEEIKDGLEALDVDELKQHVLNAHASSRSRPSSSSDPTESQAPVLSYVQLRDFTAVITATIVQALPFLAKLMTLLTSWDIRLIVARQIPILLKNLQDTRTLLDGSLRALESDELSADFSRDRFLQDRETLAENVADLGAKFDRLLDTLESRDDALPEKWIDDMDSIEADFASWVVEAERRIHYNEWIERNGTNKPPPPELLSPGFTPASRASPSKMSRANSAELQKESGSPHTSTLPEITPVTKDREVDTKPTEKPKVNLNVLRVHESVRRLRESTPHAYAGSDSPLSASEPHNGFEGTSQPGSQAPIDAHQSQVADAQLDVGRIENLGSVPEAGELAKASQKQPSKLGLGSFQTHQSQAADDGTEVSLPKSTVNGDAAANDTSQQRLSTQQNDKGQTENTDKPKRPTPLLLAHQFHKRGVSNISTADSVLSDTFTDLSSAEIMDASTAEVVGTPVFDPMPRRASVDLLSMRKPPVNPNQDETRPKSAYLSNLESPASESISDRKKKALSLSLVTLLPKSAPDEALNPRGSSNKDEQPTEKNASDSDREDEDVRRASSTPIETVFPSQIKNITLGRRGSKSTAAGPPFSPSSVYSKDAESLRPTSAENNLSRGRKLKTGSPSPPRRSTSISNSIKQGSPSHKTASPGQDARDSNLPVAKFSPPAIPRRSSRRKSQAPQVALFQKPSATNSKFTVSTSPSDSAGDKRLRLDLTNLETNDQAQPNKESSRKSGNASTPVYSPSIYSPADTAATPQSRISTTHAITNKATSPSKTTEDKIDEKISKILTTIPMKIKLAAEPLSPSGDKFSAQSNGQAETALRSTSNPYPTSKSLPTSSSISNSTRSSTPTPSLTISPARRTKTSHPPNSDVRLYHLHRNSPNQPKDTSPLKLFVRLVGQDGERVMVRVGGGWADLGEYLREYAQHHGGSRRISGNQFEVQNFPTSFSTESNPLSKSPNNLSVSKTRPSVPPRPGSALDLFNLSGYDNIPIRSSSALGANTHRPRRSTTNATLESTSPSPDLSTATPPHSLRLSDASSSAATPDIARVSPATTTTDFDFGLQEYSSTALRPNYMPLGASGPKSGIKSRASSGAHSALGIRSSSGTHTPADPLTLDPESEKWVDDMLGQARKSSGRQSTGSPGYVSGGRKANSANSGLGAMMGGVGAGGDEAVAMHGPTNTNTNVTAGPRPRPKSRMGSLEGIGGIKRVFLRRKEK